MGQSCARRSDRCARRVRTRHGTRERPRAHRHRIGDPDRSWINIKINDATRRRVPSSVSGAVCATDTVHTFVSPLALQLRLRSDPSGHCDVEVTCSDRAHHHPLVWAAQPRPYRMACALAPATLPKDHRAASPRHMAFIIALATCIIHSTQAIPRVTCSW